MTGFPAADRRKTHETGHCGRKCRGKEAERPCWISRKGCSCHFACGVAGGHRKVQQRYRAAAGGRHSHAGPFKKCAVYRGAAGRAGQGAGRRNAGQLLQEYGRGRGNREFPGRHGYGNREYLYQGYPSGCHL